MHACSSHPLPAQRSSPDLLSRAPWTLALLVITGCSGSGGGTLEPPATGTSTADSSTAGASTADPSTASTASTAGAPGTAEGGDPLEASVIPPGSGWFCYHNSNRTSDRCFRTEAECSEHHHHDRAFATTECTSIVPWCSTGGTDPVKGHALICYKDRATCLTAVSHAEKGVYWTSGCAAVP